MTLDLTLTEIPSLDSIPEEYDGYLDSQESSVCCAFNRHGTLIAVGNNDGRVIIWDFLTRIIARTIVAHGGHPVSSLSWSRDGQKLASCSVDNSVAIWQVLTGNCLIRWILNVPLIKVQFNPRNDTLLLTCPLKSPAILLSVDYDSKHIKCKTIQPEKDDQDMVASFDRRGKYIYVGTSRGRLSIFKSPKTFPTEGNIELELVSSFRISNNSLPAAITEIEFGAKNKKFFLVNSTDRSIRLYLCESAINAGIDGTCEELKRFQDMVSKTMWRRCCLSGDAEASHVCGGSARQHSLVIWDTENGTIKKMLQGGKNETLTDVQWHPLRPILASVANGLVAIWARPQIESWSAYAPEFTELEENMEYEERESEFDAEDEDKEVISKVVDDDDDEELDVVTVKPEPYLLSSDEEDIDPNSLDIIPISYEEFELLENEKNQSQQSANAD